MPQCCPALTMGKWYLGTSILHPTALLFFFSACQERVGESTGITEK